MAGDEHQYLSKAKQVTNLTSCVLLAIGIGTLLLASCAFGTGSGEWKVGLRTLGVGLGLAGASLSVGGLLGFLFGIPKGPIKAAEDRPWIVNTNLVEISDWLTKMLVGLSLAALFQIPQRLGDFGNYFAADLGSGALASTLLVHFGVSGFLIGYLMTRLFLQQGFHEADTPSEAKARPELDPGPTEADPAPPPKGDIQIDRKSSSGVSPSSSEGDADGEDR